MLAYQELTGKVIAAAIAVHQELRPGLDIALLLNFKSWPLGKKRIIRPGYLQDLNNSPP